MIKCEVIEAELFLTPKCVCNTDLCVIVDLMFWICVLGKTTFSSDVGLKPSVIQLFVCIVGHLYRPSREVKHSTESCAAVKILPIYALMAGQGRI